MQTQDGQETSGTPAAAKRYVAGQSCTKSGLKHEYAPVEGKSYSRCAKCGSTKTTKAPAAETPVAVISDPAPAPAAAPFSAVGGERTFKDFEVGQDFRGDEAMFIERSHLRNGGAAFDATAQGKLYKRGGVSGHVFFRLLQGGVQTSFHGFAVAGRIEQWG